MKGARNEPLQRTLLACAPLTASALVRQAKLGASCWVRVPAEEGLTNLRTVCRPSQA